MSLFPVMGEKDSQIMCSIKLNVCVTEYSEVI